MNVWVRVARVTFIIALSILSTQHRVSGADKLQGIWPTILTPWNDNQQVDTEALKSQVDFLVEAGVHGMVLLGSIGESPYVSNEERAVLIKETVASLAGRTPLLVGITTAGTDEAERQLRQAQRLGANYVMIALPEYFDLGFDQIKAHYEYLGGLNVLPILYYNYPAATGLELSPEQIAEILMLPGIVGIKQSTFNLVAIRKQRELTRAKELSFLSGSELTFTQFMELGGDGAVSVGSVLMPRTAVAMYDKYRAGDVSGAEKLQSSMFETMPLVKKRSAPLFLARAAFLSAIKKGLNVPLGVEPTQAKLKAALSHCGVPIKPHVKRPLPELTRDAASTAEKVMAKIMRLERAAKK